MKSTFVLVRLYFKGDMGNPKPAILNAKSFVFVRVNHNRPGTKILTEDDQCVEVLDSIDEMAEKLSDSNRKFIRVNMQKKDGGAEAALVPIDNVETIMTLTSETPPKIGLALYTEPHVFGIVESLDQILLLIAAAERD